MNNLILRPLLIAAAFSAPLLASAYDFEADGVYYNITSSSDKTVSVTSESSSSNSYSGDVVIPSTVAYNDITYSVTAIGESAFYNCTSLTSVSIGDGVTSIGNRAFVSCTSLTSVTIPDGVTSLGSSAFQYCTSLASVSIGSSVASIGDYTFHNCRSLTSVTIPDSVTSIGGSAFYYCISLESVSIGNSVSSIGDFAFYCCISLSSVTIPDSVTSIGNSAFDSCSAITSVTIPDNVTSIGNDAFYDCSSLTSVSIGNSVSSIGTAAFFGCGALTSVNTNSIEKWCGISFAEIDSNPISKSQSLLLNGVEVTELVIPDNVTSIGNYAFYYCKPLTSVTIPDSVTSIGDEAFEGTSLSLICSQPVEPPTVGSSAFSGVDNTACILSIPTGSSAGYSASSDWAAFMASSEKGEVRIEMVDIYGAASDSCVINFRKGASDGSFTGIAADGTTIFVPANGTVDFLFTPANKTEIKEVWYADEDVTSQLADNVYSMPAIGASDVKTLKVVLSSPDSGVDEISGGEPTRVYRQGGSIRVEGAGDGAVTVYNLSGQIVYNGTDTTIDVPGRGVYIVRAGGKSHKVAM